MTIPGGEVKIRSMKDPLHEAHWGIHKQKLKWKRVGV